MDTRITILATQSEDNTTDIRLTAERDYKPIFTEAFSSASSLRGVHLMGRQEIISENIDKCGSRQVLSDLLELISNGVKTEGHVYTDAELNLKSHIKDFPVIKRFEEIVGCKFDWSKFRNTQEFRNYFQRFLSKKQ